MTGRVPKRRPKTALGNVILNAPYTLWAVLFIVVPLAIVVYYAFTDANGSFTLENIKSLGDYKDTFITSIWYSLIATAITLVIAYPFAFFMSRAKASRQKLLMMLVMLPMWMNLLIRTYSWMLILEKNGIINNILGFLNIGEIKMIGTPGAVILGMVYNYLPYMILPIYTVMSKIDRSLFEAAEDLGCGMWQKLRRVVLPLSLPGVVSGITMVFVPSISTFYISYKLGGGKVQLIGDAIERQIQSAGNYNLGSALSLILMIFILISLAVMNKFSDDDGGIVI